MTTRMHWGVFIMPVIVAVVPMLPIGYLFWWYQSVFRALELTLSIPWPSFVPILMFGFPGAVGLLLAFIAFVKSEVVITDRRLRFATGVLFRFSGELSLSKIESVFVFEPVFGRLFGYGTVTVVGTGGTPFALRYVPRPHHFREQLKSAVGCSALPAPTTIPKRGVTSSIPEAAEQDDARYMPRVEPVAHSVAEAERASRTSE
ncbi:MAG TPA: PH domain-containing protein [Candidatus Acidoferrum sp.]|nr:PH domain-containing protein [Candidatus Acidoferrum sp.]